VSAARLGLAGVPPGWDVFNLGTGAGRVAAWVMTGLLVVVVALLCALVVAVRRAAWALESLDGRLRHWSERSWSALPVGGSSASPGATSVAAPAARTESAGLEARIREALDQRAWAEAAQRIEDLRSSDAPGAADRAERLLSELVRSREAQSADLKARLDAARSANDPDAVLDLHAELATLIATDARADADRELVGWFMRLLMRRMRTGTVREDVARLAERVAAAFPTTVEGASLRASLPTLRRSAGLCSTCGRAYTGVEPACPKCLAARTQGEPAPAAALSGPEDGVAEIDEPETGQSFEVHL
jgi:hypothetical protein